MNPARYVSCVYKQTMMIRREIETGGLNTINYSSPFNWEKEAAQRTFPFLPPALGAIKQLANGFQNTPIVPTAFPLLPLYGRPVEGLLYLPLLYPQPQGLGLLTQPTLAVSPRRQLSPVKITE